MSVTAEPERTKQRAWRCRSRRPRRDGWTRALVTGGSGGIGEAFARLLAQRATHLVLVARRPEPLQALAAELHVTHGVDVETLPADLTDSTDLFRIEARLEDEAEPIDLLINNAGSETEHGHFTERDRDLLQAEVQLNVVALMRLTHAAVGVMRRHGGSVINVSAGNAFFPTPGSTAYGASKAFVNDFTEALAYELRHENVSLTAICPGATRTGAQERLGLRREALPEFLWRDPEQVAVDALAAAARGKVVSTLTLSGALAASAGRHLPRRLMLPAVARSTAKFGGE